MQDIVSIHTPARGATTDCAWVDSLFWLQNGQNIATTTPVLDGGLENLSWRSEVLITTTFIQGAIRATLRPPAKVCELKSSSCFWLGGYPTCTKKIRGIRTFGFNPSRIGNLQSPTDATYPPLPPLMEAIPVNLIHRVTPDPLMRIARSFNINAPLRTSEPHDGDPAEPSNLDSLFPRTTKIL